MTRIPHPFKEMQSAARKSPALNIRNDFYKDGLAIVTVDNESFSICPIENDIPMLIQELRTHAQGNLT